VSRLGPQAPDKITDRCPYRPDANRDRRDQQCRKACRKENPPTEPTRQAKSCKQLFMSHQAKGAAIIKAITTSFIKADGSKPTISRKFAPNTLPIDFN